jgi:spermidine/putrescine ABC transporter ATP-binding subunit
MTTNLEISGLTKRFGDIVAVKDFNLSIEKGEFLTLLGPSGCGKSTTLRCIAGFEQPTKGTISLDGQDIVGVPPNKRPTSMVFQHYALFPHMTVGQNVGFGLQMRGVDQAEIDERVDKVLELVDLSGYQDNKTDELSGGQQQRVALARSLITEPDVLLLDEPLGALDLKLREQMQLELKRIQERLNITFVYVTHDQDEALTMSDKIAVMNDGHIEQVGSPTEIYQTPATRFVADFIGETNLFDGIYRSDDQAVESQDGIRVPVKADATVEEGQQLSVSLRPEALHITDEVTNGHYSLEGTVKEVIFKGNLAKINADVNGRLVTVEEHVDAEALPEEGENCNVVWKPESGYILKR